MTLHLNDTNLSFHQIVESMPNAIVLVNERGKIEYVNNRTEKLFLFHRDELVGKSIEVLIPDRFAKHHPHFRENYMHSSSVRPMGAGRDLFAKRKDNTEIPVEIGLNPIESDKGKLVLASIIDISERKKAEKRFRQVVESAPNAMILVDTTGTINLINTECEKLFGYDRSELLGQKMEILLPHRFRKAHPSFRNHFFKVPSARPMGVGRDLHAMRKDGSEVMVEIGLNPIDTDEGQMVLASILDISERKQKELTIQLQLEELGIKNKALEHFAYIASHDLQEPLRTISNYITVIQEDFENNLDPDLADYLNHIGNASERMKNLVKALLNFSRLGRNSTLKKCNLNSLLHEVLSDINTLIEENNVEIDTEELPNINVYEAELRQVFQNIISNAVKFRRDGKEVVISIRYLKRKNLHQFSIADNGIGIASEHQERIFDIFSRLHGQEKYSGYGIGLANCKKIVELHGGTIWVDSEIDKGSTFHFTLKELDNV